MSIPPDVQSLESKRTWLCAVVFLDVVGYTKVSVEQQIKIKGHMNSVIEKSIDGIAEIDRIIVDSGDGAALCFLADPEDSLFCAVKLRDGFVALFDQDEDQYEVCIGINLGPVKVVQDVNNRRNVLGDGINIAQRIMSFAPSGKIYVSRSFYEVISCLSKEYDDLFHYRGKMNDKHEREHTVYEFNTPSNTGTPSDKDNLDLVVDETSIPSREEKHEGAIEKIVAPQIQTETGIKSYDWDSTILQSAEIELTRHIGPLARILVKKLAKTTNNIHKLYEQMGDVITDPHQRADFLKHIPAASTIADSKEPKTIKPVSNPPNQKPSKGWDDQELHRIEQHLAVHLGPLARILVEKAANQASSINELYNLLSTNLNDEEARRAFMKTMH